jgi:exopolysaccharide biosynthesis protein
MVGLGAVGRRLILVTVDGRQAGYSVGMTLRESAQLMRELGATQALNLDGGGSSTMVVRRSWENAVRYTLANKPSDKEGERSVANALAVISDPARCLTR